MGGTNTRHATRQWNNDNPRAAGFSLRGGSDIRGVAVCETVARTQVRSRGGVNRLSLGAVLLGAAALALAGCRSTERGGAVRAGDEPIRALWVTRWDFKTADDVTRVMENARRAGFNTVLFQVRGNGTSLYRSRIEPWADELDGRDPGFDPLALACTEAHRRGLTIHAWANVMPAWRGKNPPTDRRQLYHTHPEWFWLDERGRRQPLGWYQSLNPCYPEVRRYIVSVMHEIVSRYPVDGLHLDYIRFPNEWNSSYPAGAKVPDYPRDPRTLAMFRQATGHTPESAPQKWSAWRSDQVTQLVREIRRMVSQTKPRVWLTAAVGAEPDEALRNHFQDSHRWLDEGLLDAVFPMNYAADHETFERRVAKWRGRGGRTPVVMGIMFDGRSPDVVNRQVAHAVRGCGHFAAFAYNALFDRPGDGKPGEASPASGERRALRAGVIPHIRQLSSGARVAGR